MAIVSSTGSSAPLSRSGMCSGAVRANAGVEHLGIRQPADLTAPRTWLTNCVRLFTRASRLRITARSARACLPRCCTVLSSFGSISAHSCQVLGIQPVGLVVLAIDQLQPPRVSHQHLMTQLLQLLTHPRRVRSNLQHYSRRASSHPNRLASPSGLVLTRPPPSPCPYCRARTYGCTGPLRPSPIVTLVIGQPPWASSPLRLKKRLQSRQATAFRRLAFSSHLAGLGGSVADLVAC